MVICKAGRRPHIREMRYFSLIFIASLIANVGPLFAQEKAAQEDVAQHNAGPVVVELYTSRTCLFCPQADLLFEGLLAQPHVIGIACHVSYFDARRESMVRPFCSKRQSWYMNALQGGLNFTPQMIFNGTKSVIGYRADDVAEALRAAGAADIRPIGIAQEEHNVFMIDLPKLDVDAGADYQLSVFMLDKTRALPVLSGSRRGEMQDFPRIADALDVMAVGDSVGGRVRVDVEVKDGQERLVALLQNVKTGAVMAAGAHIIARE